MSELGPQTLDEAVAAAVAKVLDPRHVQAVVEEKLDTAVDLMVGDALDWRFGSASAKAMRAKLDELVVPAIERMSLDNARLDLLLSRLVQDSVVGERARLLGKYAELCQADAPKHVTATDMLDRYGKWCASEWDCAGREVDGDYEEPEYKPLTCSVELCVRKDNGFYRSLFDRAVVVLVAKEDDEEQVEKTRRVVYLSRYRGAADDDEWTIEPSLVPEASSIAAMSDFDVWLTRLKICRTKLDWDLLQGRASDEFYCAEKPQWELS